MGQLPKHLYGVETDLPSAITNGTLYFITDKGRIYFDINGSRFKLYETDINAAKQAGVDAQSNVDALEATVGTPDAGKTIVQMIKAVEAEITGSGSDGSKTLAERIADAEAAITTLNADASTTGSVQKSVADAIAALVAGADTNFDTLKEIADWITNDTTGAAKMANDINTLKGADTVEGSVAKSIKDAVEALDVADTAVTGKYVSAVEQVDGKITVTRADLPNMSALEWGTFTDLITE